jgi:hypothetical protein
MIDSRRCPVSHCPSSKRIDSSLQFSKFDLARAQAIVVQYCLELPTFALASGQDFREGQIPVGGGVTYVGTPVSRDVIIFRLYESVGFSFIYADTDGNII